MKKVIFIFIALMLIAATVFALGLNMGLDMSPGSLQTATPGGPSGDGFISTPGNYFISSSGNYFTSN
jgi:hypothetical protein